MSPMSVAGKLQEIGMLWTLLFGNISMENRLSMDAKYVENSFMDKYSYPVESKVGQLKKQIPHFLSSFAAKILDMI